MNRAAAIFTTMFIAIGDRFEGRKDKGATAVEYGLMVGLIGVAIIAAVTFLGDGLKDLFTDIGKKLTDINP
jgi:pilus assembly protein Flp/PilA